MLPAPRPALVLLALGLVAAQAAAWTPESQRAIADDAARLAPPDLQRQLVRNRPAYRVGVEEPFRDADLARHLEPEDGSGRLDETVAWAVEQAILSIRGFRPFNEIAYRLGLVSHFVADVNDPLVVSRADPRLPVYADDYPRYLDSARPRFQVVFYGFHSDAADPRVVPRIVRDAIARSRGFSPHVAREYRRVGFAPGRLSFDDRSTAYGVGALSYSHAVSDVAEALRQVWLTAGGTDSRPRLPERGRHLFYLRSPATGALAAAP